MDGDALVIYLAKLVLTIAPGCRAVPLPLPLRDNSDQGEFALEGIAVYKIFDLTLRLASGSTGHSLGNFRRLELYS